MSDDEYFQSADKECSLEIVNVTSARGYSITPRKRLNEPNLQWKFEKIKKIPPISIPISRFPETRNISFQTDDLVEVSHDEDDNEDGQCCSSLASLYEDCQRVYKKQKAVGTSWVGKKQYFASVFVDPIVLAKADLSIYKQQQIPTALCSFDSCFESGNLYSVYKINENEYDLILQNDINTKGNTQWFYFQIYNIPAKKKIKLNIVNMLKSDSLFNYGMQPCIHSMEAERRNGQGWVRGGNEIKYFKNENKVDGSNRFYYTLTFTVTTPWEGDTLKISQCYPYTVEDLNRFLEGIEKKYGKKGILKRESAGSTVGKNSIEVLRIMEENPRKKSDRPVIIITARQHPGETPGSFVCEGFVEFILSDEKQAQFLRKNYEFHILPMLNPDGVMVGNYRSNLFGLDLNRRWDGSRSKQALECVLVKKYIHEISKGKQVAFMIDLHGHSRKLFSFFYGNVGAETPQQVRIFPYICSKLSENSIRFEDSTFACEQAKRKTARIQLGLKLKIPNIFTFETSFFGYINKNREKVHYSQQKYKNLGITLVKSMFYHERHRVNPQCLQALQVKKFYDELKNKPELIKCGDKVGSGSESEPEKGEIQDVEYNQLQGNEQFSKQITQQKNKKRIKKQSKKQIVVKQNVKNSRQLYVMDIARVNSIFPNDILALMPSSAIKYSKNNEKIKKQQNGSIDAMIQTEDVPLIKIYDVCKIQELRDKKQEVQKRKIGIKNEQEGSNASRSNLFRTIIRPKSSSNAYLQINMSATPNKREIRKRHESGIQIKNPKRQKVNVMSQTMITFSPDADFMAKTLDTLVISPATKTIDHFRTRSKFASTINPESQTKHSSQSFKIGLRALNVETWRVKKRTHFT